MGEGDNTTDAKIDTGAAQLKPHTGGVGRAQWDLPPPASTPSAGNADKTALVSLSVEKAPKSDPESPIPHSADYSIKISPHIRNQPFLVPGMDPPTLSRGGSLEEDPPPALRTAELPDAGGAQATVVADVPKRGDENTDAKKPSGPNRSTFSERAASLPASSGLLDTDKRMVSERKKGAGFERSVSAFDIEPNSSSSSRSSGLFRKKALMVKALVHAKNANGGIERHESDPRIPKTPRTLARPAVRSTEAQSDLLKEVGRFLDTTDVVHHYDVGQQEKRQTSAVTRVRSLIVLAQVVCVVYAVLILVERDSGHPGQPGLTVWNTGSMSEQGDWTSFDDLCTAKCAPDKWLKASPAICEKDLLCSWGLAEVLLLAGARVTAYAMYAPLIMIFVSKCKGIGTILHGSGLELWLPLPELHELHVLLGHELWTLGVAHTLFHLVRWGLHGSASIKLLWSSACGRSGAIAMFMLLPIMFMAGPRRLRKAVSWEMRKGMHMASIGYAIALCFHSTNMAGVMAFSLLIYVADVLLVYGKFTWKSEDTLFSNVGTGTQVSFRMPAGRAKVVTGFINLCVPFVSPSEWHPFSCYSDPKHEGHLCIYAQSVDGGWTEKLNRLVTHDTHMPVWVQGAARSTFLLVAVSDRRCV